LGVRCTKFEEDIMAWKRIEFFEPHYDGAGMASGEMSVESRLNAVEVAGWKIHTIIKEGQKYTVLARDN
jgi:hypothetical protein